MEFFKNHLNDTGNVPANEIPYYVHWVSRCYEFCQKPHGAPLGNHQVDDFLSVIGARLPENQVRLAGKAIASYRYLYHKVQSDDDGRSASFEDQWDTLLCQFIRAALTEEIPSAAVRTYTESIKSFLEFWKGVRPTDLSDIHALLYLTHCNGERALATAMSSETAEALAIFYRRVIQQNVCFFMDSESKTKDRAA